MNQSKQNDPIPSRTSGGAVGLERRYFTSAEIFDHESARIFSRHWNCVGRIEQLDPHSRTLPIEFENHKLFVTLDETDTPHAFRNFCRHRGSQLVTSDNCSSIRSRIQCPYHQWTYDRSGKLVSAPNMDGVESFCTEEHGLLEVACEIHGGFIWICFEPKDAVAQFLHPIKQQFDDWQLDQLRLAHELKYDVHANWKLIFQNYSECYHCPAVHPMLNQLTPFQESTNDLESGPILGGPMKLSDDSQTMSTTGKLAGKVLPGLNELQSRSVNYFTIFPSMFFSSHPDYVLIHLIERITCEQTRVSCQFLFHPDAMAKSDFDPQPAIDFWDLTNRQDWEVCELSQAGISDPAYIPGHYSNLESIVAAFDQHYLSVISHD